MRISTLRIVSAGLTIAAAALATPVWAGGGAGAAPVADAQANAAPRYWQGMYLLEARLQKNPDLNLSTVNDRRAVDWAAVEALRPLVGESREELDIIMSASRMSSCDFIGDSLDRLGPATLLPHVGAMRRTAQVLTADALQKARDGKTAESAECFAAIIRMAHHTQGDGVLLTSLVSSAMIIMVEPAIGGALQSGAFTPQDKAVITEALKSLDNDDPLAIIAAIKGERDNFIGWIRRVQSPGKPMDPRLDELLTGIPDADEDGPVRVIRQTVDRGDSIEPYIKLAEAYYDQAMKAWKSDKARERLSELAQQADRGTFGPLTRLLCPSWSKILDSEARGIAAIATMHTLLGQ